MGSQRAGFDRAILTHSGLVSNAGDPNLIPELGRSPGEGKGYLLQYSSLENSMDCIVRGVTKSRAQLSNFHFLSFTSEKCLYKFFADFSVVDI